jgi:hypothetical protein
MTHVSFPPPSLEIRRLATSVPLRLSSTAISETIAHLHADLTGTDRSRVAADLHTRFPGFQALLTHRLATVPASCATTIDATLLRLALAEQPGELEEWVGELAYALAA